MKNLFKSLLAFALLATACSKDANIDPSKDSANQIDKQTFCTPVEIETAQTKVNITDNDTAGLDFKWQLGDVVSIYQINDVSTMYSTENVKVAEYKISSIENGFATFSVDESTFASTIDPANADAQYVAAYLVKNKTTLAERLWSFATPIYNKDDNNLKYLANAAKAISGKFSFNGSSSINFNHEMAYQQFKIVRPTAVSGYSAQELEDIYANTENLYIGFANNQEKLGGYRFIQIKWSDFAQDGENYVLDFHVPISAGEYSELLMAFCADKNGTSPQILFSKVLKVSSPMQVEVGVRYKNNATIDGSEYYKVQGETPEPPVEGLVEISSYEQLADFRDKINSGEFALDTDVKLTGNITFPEGVQWAAINNEKIDSQVYYTGTFDGNDCSITGLNVTEVTEGIEVHGLFGYFGGIIKDLTMNTPNVAITTTNSNLSGAAIASSLGETAAIINCHVIGGVIKSNARSGAIAGVSFATGAEIVNCSAQGTIIQSTASKNGGIVGEFAGDVVGCYSTADLSAGKSDNWAGIVGLFGPNGYIIGNYVYDSKLGVGSATAQTGGVIGDYKKTSKVTVQNDNYYYSATDYINASVDAKGITSLTGPFDGTRIDPASATLSADVAAANEALKNGVVEFNATAAAANKAEKYVVIGADGTPSFATL